METLKILYEKSAALRKGEQETVQWAKEQKIFYAFNREGDMLAVRKQRLFRTKAGKFTWPYDPDGIRKDDLLEEEQERTVLDFIGQGKKTFNGRFRLEIPMPCDFVVKEITCQDNIFSIWSQSEREPVSGTYNVIHEAIMLVESMYYSSADGVGEDVIDKCFYEYLLEDHQNYLKKVELEKRTSTARNSRTAKKENFYKEKNGEYICQYETRVWGNKADICITCKETLEWTDKTLADVAKKSNLHIKWIDQNRESIQKAILEEDMVELACQWMEGYETTGEDGKTYYKLEDGSRLPAPVTEEVFLNSLRMEGIDASCSENKFEFELFIGMKPDFFACHEIEVSITATQDSGYEIIVNGLAG